MNDSEKWATSVLTAERQVKAIFAQPHNSAKLEHFEPSLAVPRATGNVFLCGAPTEFFSEKMPIDPNPKNETLRPIDVLYGIYFPDTSEIEIYLKNIERDAPLFYCTTDELTSVVRAHEYAHAVVHLGVPMMDSGDQLSDFGVDGRTDWDKFGTNRCTAFSDLDVESHEFLAQAITWATLSQNVCLAEVFNELEKRQPRHYMLPDEIKRCARDAAWPLVLKATRGEILTFPKGEEFRMVDGLQSLVRQSAVKNPVGR